MISLLIDIIRFIFIILITCILLLIDCFFDRSLRPILFKKKSLIIYLSIVIIITLIIYFANFVKQRTIINTNTNCTKELKYEDGTEFNIH